MVEEKNNNHNTQQEEVGKKQQTPMDKKSLIAEKAREATRQVFDIPEEGESMDDFMSQIENQGLDDIGEGQILTGTVIQVTENEVLVDVGLKSEGVISIREFQPLLDTEGIKVGDKVDVLLESTEDKEGLIHLSKEKADKIKLWDKLSEVFNNSEIVSGRVLQRIKGGLTVDIGVRAFLPGSQIDLRPVKNLDDLVGKTIDVKIIKLNKFRGNIVVSRRVVLEEQYHQMREETLSKLKPGNIIEGIVKNITEYGAFIDLGGVDGLLHITDMSWGRISKPSDLFYIGQQVDVMVLNYDPERERVSLGYKQKTEDPWLKVEEKYPIGSIVKGKVISVAEYGAFVELEEGVEGLIHVSEMSWVKRVREASAMVNEGDLVEARVLDIDPENRRISLSMKKTEPNPWDLMEQKYPIGTRVKGRVRNITNFGVFVEIEEGIDGLIHISDLSYTERVRHPSDMLKEDEEVEAVVHEIDAQNQRISLSLKHAMGDPWDAVEAKYKVGMEVKGKVTRLTDFGVFVELEKGIEGLVHISELDTKRVKTPKDVLNPGDEKVFRIIKVDPLGKKIGLSLKAMLEEPSDLPRADEDLDVVKKYLDDSDEGFGTGIDLSVYTDEDPSSSDEQDKEDVQDAEDERSDEQRSPEEQDNNIDEEEK